VSRPAAIQGALHKIEVTPEKKTILVTGGAGYIGAHACKALAAEGYTPVVVDNLSTGHPEAVKWGPLEEGEVGDERFLDQVFARHRPMAVMHFAACALVGESMTDPGKYYRNNVAGTLALIEAMARHEVKQMVFSSSCATYGLPRSVPMTEENPQQPINPYGRTKLIAENLLKDFEASHGIRHVALRYFNAAGADPEGEIGEDHDPETHLIPIILDAALGRRRSVTIFGEDYPTPDGTCIRDYVHVADLAQAHLLALKHLGGCGASLQVNLGNGQGYSVRQVLKVAENITGIPIDFKVGERREGDPPRLVADAFWAKETLGWEPKYTSLEIIMQHAWDWHQVRFAD
jgi:UDP-arabinose 4-epimerase